MAVRIVLAGLGWCIGNNPYAATGTPVAEGSWQKEPQMNHARAAHAVVSTGKAIYALGGTGARGTPVLDLEQFNGKEWKDEGTIPGQGINAPAAAGVNGKIYLIGGFNTVTNVPSAEVYVYDTTSRRWARAAPLPRPRGGHSAVVLDGKIHVVGGGNSQATIPDHDVYDPVTDTWKALAPLPRGTGSTALAAFAGKLYAIGGRSGRVDFGTVEIYDPITNAWTKGPPIDPRGTAGAVAYCGAIYVFGGESQDQGVSLGEVLRWNGSGTWQQVSSMPTARNYARAVVFGDGIYVVGGSKRPGPSHAPEGSAVVERYTVHCP